MSQIEKKKKEKKKIASFLTDFYRQLEVIKTPLISITDLIWS